MDAKQRADLVRQLRFELKAEGGTGYRAPAVNSMGPRVRKRRQVGYDYSADRGWSPREREQIRKQTATLRWMGAMSEPNNGSMSPRDWRNRERAVTSAFVRRSGGGLSTHWRTFVGDSPADYIPRRNRLANGRRYRPVALAP